MRSAGAACLYEVEVVHVRSAPLRHDVRSSSYQWFVDLDDLPHVPLLARFDAADHLGDPSRTIRQNVEAFLAENGIDLGGGRISMLTNARSMGYVFNPLSLFWCHGADGDVRCVIAEVHNTYGGRHCYLLEPDDAGRAETEKAFYVSPFYPVDGFYRMSVPEPDEKLSITITLHRNGERPFTASVRGVRRAAGAGGMLAAAVRNPLATWAVRAAISRHGIALYLKGLPVQPRPPHEQSAGVGTPRRGVRRRRDLEVTVPTKPTEPNSPRSVQGACRGDRARGDRARGDRPGPTGCCL